MKDEALECEIASTFQEGISLDRARKLYRIAAHIARVAYLECVATGGDPSAEYEAAIDDVQKQFKGEDDGSRHKKTPTDP